VLKASGYLLRWSDTFHLCEGDHLRISELKCVDLIAWDSLRLGNGYRSLTIASLSRHEWLAHFARIAENWSAADPLLTPPCIAIP
jgi:hypothetical protein